MPSAGRRSEELQKKLQRRNNSLKPADFTKEQTIISQVEKIKDPVAKSKAALSDLRKRINERKMMSKLVGNRHYEDSRDDPVPGLTGIMSDDSPFSSERQEVSPKNHYLANTVTRSTDKLNKTGMESHVLMKNKSVQKVHFRSIKDHYKNQDRYRKEVPNEGNMTESNKAPPAHIEVRSSDVPNDDDDDNSEVSEITTDVRIMSTKGASYVERRMAGKVQMRLARPSLSAPLCHALEKDVNINVRNLRHLGKAVDRAKLDLQQELSPTNANSSRFGLPYESTDFRPSVDEDEGDSWEEAIRTGGKQQRFNLAERNIYSQNASSPTNEQNGQFIADKNAARKLQQLAKEAYSYEGDVFIDATEIREEDLDGEVHVLSSEGGNHTTPIQMENTTIDPSVHLGNKILPSEDEEEKIAINKPSLPTEETNGFPQQSQEEEKEEELDEPSQRSDNGSHYSTEDRIMYHGIDNINPVNTPRDNVSLEDKETESSNSTNDPAKIASDLYKSSLVFFKSFSSQVDTQLKAFQERGLISKSDMDGMLGILEHDVNETESNLPDDGNDVVIFFGDELEATACGTNLSTIEGKQTTDEKLSNNNKSRPDPVEKMLESLKKSYNTGISKCGIDSDLINENKKAIEEVVANLKKAKNDSFQRDQSNATWGKFPPKAEPAPIPEDNTLDGDLLKEFSSQGVEDMVNAPNPPSAKEKGNNKATTQETKTFILPVKIPLK